MSAYGSSAYGTAVYGSGGSVVITPMPAAASAGIALGGATGGGSVAPASGTADALTWYEPDGTPHALSGNAIVNVLVGRRGLFGPPAALIADAVPLQPGTRVRAIRLEPREVDLPLFVEAADPAALRAQLRAIDRWFDPTRGDGRLRVTSPGGDVRELVCRAPLSLQVDEGTADAWGRQARALVTLYAADPDFLAATPTAATFSLGTPAVWFPLPPLLLTPSVIAASATVTNPGDADAHPVWTITGPAAYVTLRNTTTGQSLTLARRLYAGDTVVVDTRRGVRTVSMAGANVYNQLAAGSALWWLTPGANTVQVEMPGVSTASSVGLSYYPRYRTA
jgi:phage-related protein